MAGNAMEKEQNMNTPDVVRAFIDTFTGRLADHVSCELVPTIDLKVKWMRTCGIMRFDITDYLKDMPYDLAVLLADHMAGRIQGNTDCKTYPPEVCDWLQSEAFLTEENIGKYLARNCAWIDSFDGMREIWEAHTDKPFPVIAWGDRVERGCKTSLLFNTIILDRRLIDHSVARKYMLLGELEWLMRADFASNYTPSTFKPTLIPEAMADEDVALAKAIIPELGFTDRFAVEEDD